MFKFKLFTIKHGDCPAKLGTDSVLLGAWADVTSVDTALDIGTGSGVIALMLAQRNLQMHITALDIQADCCAVAGENFNNSPWADRLTLINTTIQQYASQKRHAFDLIVSNPPFYNGPQPKEIGKQLYRHSAHLPHTEILKAAKNLLTGTGRLCVILPVTEANHLIGQANDYHLFLTNKTAVISKKKKKPIRLLLQFEKTKKNISKKNMVMREAAGAWTKEYKELVGDFYL